ncbi:hypothetical protein IJ798_01870 [Candidatus Saccharibacteria bacterium]|nr:hypothetical protein [Candidatus Saccharibacteria bacterium]
MISSNNKRVKNKAKISTEKVKTPQQDNKIIRILTGIGLAFIYTVICLALIAAFFIAVNTAAKELFGWEIWDFTSSEFWNAIKWTGIIGAILVIFKIITD